jgi:hypothetical protein
MEEENESTEERKERQNEMAVIGGQEKKRMKGSEGRYGCSCWCRIGGGSGGSSSGGSSSEKKGR